jgi:branched-chain amino acid transport system substrate-binding protein
MRNVTRKFYPALLVALLTALVAGCGEEEDPRDFEAGPLGAGEAIQLRTMLSHTGAPTFGLPLRYGVELALQDTGDIHGREVELGEPIDGMCSGAGGKAGALEIISDPRLIVGVLGTSCSGAAVAASPLTSGAGLVMISPSNTSPGLTSDLEGNASADFYPGYFRTSNNALYEAQVVADFAYQELELRRMVTVDDGDAYTMGLAVAFANAFRALGGEVGAARRIDKGQTDMTDVLADIAADDDVAPLDGIFFPLFFDEGSPFAEQAKAFAGLEDVTLITDSGLLTPRFLSTPQSLGIYFAGPVPVVESNVNEVTGKSTGEVLAAYRTLYGEPETPFWVHAYDAATLLLSSIESVAVEVDGRLYVDRAALRDAITETQDFQGLLGMLSCDEFGDCGTGGVSITATRTRTSRTPVS